MDVWTQNICVGRTGRHGGTNDLLKGGMFQIHGRWRMFPFNVTQIYWIHKRGWESKVTAARIRMNCSYYHFSHMCLTFPGFFLFHQKKKRLQIGAKDQELQHWTISSPRSCAMNLYFWQENLYFWQEKFINRSRKWTKTFCILNISPKCQIHSLISLQ